MSVMRLYVNIDHVATVRQARRTDEPDPVPAAKPIVAGQLDDPAVANSPLVFPTEAELARLSEYPVTETIESHDKWTALFDPIIQS